MSSEKTATNLRKYGWRIEFIRVWKVAGALVRPCKPHYSKLKVAKGCVDGCPRDFLILDSNLMVPSSQIKLRKVTTALNRIEKVVYTWQESFVLDRDPI